MCYSIKENKIEFSLVVGQNKLVVSFYVIVILMGGKKSRYQIRYTIF
jgi:hypothetical protein